MKDMNKVSNLEETYNVTFSEIVYLMYFAIMLFARGIGLYEGMLLYNISLVIGMLLFGIKILSTEHTLFEYVWMGVLLALSVIVYMNTGEKGLLVYTTMMLGLKGVSLMRVFKTGLITWSIAFGTLIILTVSGFMPERIFMHNKNGIGYLICHSLGYSHSNVLHISYIVLMIFIVYVIGKVGKKKLLIMSLALMLGNIYIFMYSVSYTGFIGATCFLVFNLYFQMRKEISKAENIIIQSVFPICVAFSVVGPLVIKGWLFDIINKALNTRYFLSNYFLTEQPITMLGSRLVVPNYRYTMDCSYVYAFVQLGIIPFILICLLYFMLIRDCLKNGRKIELAIILGLCVAGVAEPFMFNLSYKNLIFLFAGAYLFRLSDKIYVKAPKLLHKRIQFIEFGNNVISIKKNWVGGKSGRLYGKADGNSKHPSCMISIIIAAVAIIVTAGIFVATVPKPEYVYIDEKTNENMEISPEYLSQEDVDLLVSKGNIVLNYTGKQAAMYGYSGGTATLEYYRMMVSVCVAVAAGYEIVAKGIIYVFSIMKKQMYTGQH